MTYTSAPYLSGNTYPDDPTLTGLLQAIRKTKRDWHVHLAAFLQSNDTRRQEYR